MLAKGKATKTEIFLLLLTAMFAVLACSLYFIHRTGDMGYAVTVQKGNGAEEITVQKVNINTADVETLQTLEGIGPVLAQRIVDWRAQGGIFETVEDLLKINGIGEKTLEQLREFIITEDEP